ncbi:hypothetical protein L3Q82_014907 [Scortum barcoo]|uniref:Uncharacterized protein n=1 Tax=Scortum barcoo TaxID=214431 RepID=A0ACB8VSH0_9TELE|nr:hypothetical protein L3Q82_014907 [Scortum barcoo]
MAVRLPLASTWRAVRPPKEMPPHTITDPLPNRSCWKDVAGSRTFSTASPDSYTFVTCAQCEPAFICEEHRAPVANLPILVFSGKCQTSCTMLGCKHNPHLWTSGPHTTLMESVSDRLSRHMHICGLLEVILQGSGSAPPVPPCTKAEVAVLLLGCCPPTASSVSPDVLACLLPSGKGQVGSRYKCNERDRQTSSRQWKTPAEACPASLTVCTSPPPPPPTPATTALLFITSPAHDMAQRRCTLRAEWMEMGGDWREKWLCPDLAHMEVGSSHRPGASVSEALPWEIPAETQACTLNANVQPRSD